MVNIERLMANLKLIGEIGRDDQGGISRLAFSPAYFQALYQLKKLADQKGYASLQDKVGNLFITYNPHGADSFLMMGSHLDTVQNGGLYDGSLGVLAGLEVLDCVVEEGLDLKHGLILAVFNAEEGGPMGGTFGSRTITGLVDLKDPALAEKLSDYFLTREDLGDSIWDFSPIKAFLEVHIEQGSYLIDQGADIGVVEGIVGIYRYDFHIYGTSNHAGTTPMLGRDDPMPKMTAFIQTLYQEAAKYDHPFVMTVGNIQVKPGMYSVIPNEVVVQVEIRDINTDHLDQFIHKMKAYLDETKDRYKMVKNVEKGASLMADVLVESIETAAEEADYKAIRMSSGAGHDSNPLSLKVPTGMIFVPSVGGISHSPEEYTSQEQIYKGADTLMRTLLKLDQNLTEK